ncbi:MAG: hypothetical protein V4634_11640 [Pseudomonadota bacterium]
MGWQGLATRIAGLIAAVLPLLIHVAFVALLLVAILAVIRLRSIVLLIAALIGWRPGFLRILGIVASLGITGILILLISHLYSSSSKK